MTDRKVLRRGALLLSLALAAAGLASCDLLDETNAVTVTTVIDGGDADPGDGICEMTVGAEDCSLRAAIDEANANAAIVAVAVPAGTYVLDDTGVAEDANASGDLDIAPAAGHLVVEGPDRGVVVDADGAAGGIDARSGILVTWGLSVTGSSGDGHVARSGATSSVLLASPHGNAGAGVRFDAGSSGQLLSSTSSGNGTGVDNDGNLSIRFSTITANDGPGLGGSGTSTVQASVVVDQSAGPDCAAAIASTGWNAFGEVACGIGPNDSLTTDLDLVPATLDGVPAFEPGGRSFDVRDAIPVGSGGCVGTLADQGTTPRPVGSACDKGAIESAAPAIDLVVDAAVDAPDSDLTDGVCDDGTGACTLRAAVDEANVQGGATAADFDPVTITIADGIDPVMTTYDRLVIAGGVTIEGGGATIDFQSHDDAAIQVRHQGVRFHDLTLAHTGTQGAPLVDTAVAGGSGASIELEDVVLDDIGSAAVRMDGGDLTLVDVTYVSISSSDTAFEGTVGSMRMERVSVDGADRVAEIVADGNIDIVDSELLGGYDSTLVGDVVTIEGTTIAYSWGLAVSGEVVVRNSTISDNFGGLSIVNATANIIGSTIVDNAAFPTVGDYDLGIDNSIVVVRGSIVGGSGYPACRYGPAASFVSAGHNVTTGLGCQFEAIGDQVVGDTLLAPLADNGGPAITRLPLSASPALDAVPVGTAQLCDGSLPTDQRGSPRPSGPACDAGSAEAEDIPIVFVVDSPADVLDANPGDGSCDDGSGACTLRAAIAEANVAGGATASTFEPVTISIGPGVNPEISLPWQGPGSPYDSEPLAVRGGLTIEGNGATIDLNRTQRGFEVCHQYLALENLTIIDPDTSSNGVIRDRGCAGSSEAAVSLDHVTIDGNGGGGFEAISMWQGSFAMVDSAILDVSGTALLAGDMSSVRIERSTIDQNETAIDITAGDLVILGSHITRSQVGISAGAATVVDGSTFDSLGAVSVTGTLAMTNSTVTHLSTGPFTIRPYGPSSIRASTLGDNDVDGLQPGLGADLYVEGGTITVAGTVFANTSGGTSASTGYPSCRLGTGGSIVSGGYNVGADTTCGLTAVGDLQGTAPRLGALGDHGGSTPTRVPSATSPAVDRIPVGTIGLCDGTRSPDQRGVTRPQGGACDAGAVERSGLDG